VTAYCHSGSGEQAEERTAMLKPDDPAWTKLVAEIRAVLASRSDDEFAFASLHRCEQWDFFTTSGFYGGHVDQGMTEAQITRVIRNALDGKPQEKWLDGVFDEQALENPSNASFAAMVEEKQTKTPDREAIRKMLDDVEAVTKGRFFEDPEPIASPVEMFLIRDSRPGGEPFAQLSMREKRQVLDDYTDWRAYETAGISFEQLDRVFWNAAQGKPREEWLDGTIPDVARETAGKLSLGTLRAMASERAKQPEDGRNHDKEMDR
jgi:hypothetical protein